MKVLCIADIHGEASNIKLLKNINPEIILIGGDITNFGGIIQASNVLNEFSNICHKIFAVPGNCDYPEVLKLLEEKNMNLHGKGIKIGDTGIFGVGGSNPTPFGTPFEINENKITELLKESYEQVKNSKVKILLTHAPPFGILDRTSSGLNAGSKAIREFLESYKVDYVICGHIHESFGVVEFNNTIIINPGNFSLGCYLIDLTEKKIERINFI